MDMGSSLDNLQMTTPPEEKKFPNFLRFPVASQLGVGPYEHTTSILYMLQCWVIWSCAGNHSYSEFMSAIASSCHRRQHFTASLISAFRLSNLQFSKSSMLYASVFLYIFLLYWFNPVLNFSKAFSEHANICVCIFTYVFLSILFFEAESLSWPRTQGYN